MSTDRLNSLATAADSEPPQTQATRADWRRTPIVFGPKGAQLFGLHYAPDTELARDTAIVLCNSFGYEVMCLHRAYREVAEQLAGCGFHVLRFDYHGTGDSAGHDDEPCRVRAWLSSIALAIEELKRRAGVSSVSLFGLRLGGTLSLATAAERTDVDAVIAWAPSLSGRAFVRELRAFQMAKAADEDVVFKGVAAGDMEVGGYLLTSDTCNELAELDTTKLSLKNLKRALILSRDDLPTNDARLLKSLRANGVEVETDAPAGYALMARDAEYTQVPSAALVKISEFMCRAFPARSPRSPVSGIADTVLEATARSGPSVLEHAFNFGIDEQLFGILTTPSAGTPLEKTAVIFTNVGSNHHVGSNRLYVTISRELAARGIAALRFDISGIGDSRARSGKQENRIYALESISDVRQAISYLEQNYGIQNFVLAGICSGAYLAFHTAVVDQRVSAQILINAQTFEWHEGDSLEIRQRRYKSVRFYRYALLHPSTWTRVLNGEVNTRGIMRYLAERAYARAKISISTSILRKVHPKTPIESGFYQISDRGAQSLLLYSASDAGVDVIANYLGPGARKMQRRKNFQMEIIEGADHTFTPRWSQRDLTRRIVNYVTKTFENTRVPRRSANVASVR